MFSSNTSAEEIDVIRGEAVFMKQEQTVSWTVPTGVTSISVVAVGGGGGTSSAGGNGGGLSYKNDIAVTPGETLTVFVGAGYGNAKTFEAYDGQSSYVARGATNLILAQGAGASDTIIRDGGGNGGAGNQRGGGGAAGYSGNGGSGDPYGGSPTSGSGGGGAGGDGNSSYGGGGGGVGLYGEGASGVATSVNSPVGGEGGSGGSSGGYGITSGAVGGTFGGGSGVTGISYVRSAGNGGVRIVWPGADRQFPSTDVGSE